LFLSELGVEALRIEDLFWLKLASGRARDLDDLDLLAPRTTADALVARWNQLIKWHGERHAILGFAGRTGGPAAAAAWLRPGSDHRSARDHRRAARVAARHVCGKGSG